MRSPSLAGWRLQISESESSGLLARDPGVAPRDHDDPDDSFVIERQAHRKVTLIRHLASFTPASCLVRPGDDVALSILELRLRLFQGELLVSPSLLKHLPACWDATKSATWRHGFYIGIEQILRGSMCSSTLPTLSRRPGCAPSLPLLPKKN